MNMPLILLLHSFGQDTKGKSIFVSVFHKKICGNEGMAPCILIIHKSEVIGQLHAEATFP
jgi:hypothetical protein